MFWGILFVCICTAEVVRILKRMISMLEGRRELRRVKALPEQPIRLLSMQNNKSHLTEAFLMSILAGIAAGYACYLVMSRIFNLFLLIGFVMMLLGSCMDLIQVFFLYQDDEICYLTGKGIVAMEGVYQKGDCRFVMEEELTEDGNGGKYLCAYKKKNTVPYRFRVLERESEVLEMIHHLSEVVVKEFI